MITFISSAFPQPEEFRPERFLGEDAARAQKAWMPFGGGRRYCVGAQLALAHSAMMTDGMDSAPAGGSMPIALA